MELADLTWLHLSDFHMGKDNYAQHRILEHSLTEIGAVSQSWRKPDFVFITGDLANNGRDEEFAAFDKEFLVPLSTELGDAYLSRVFIVPGNHDVDRTQAKAVRRYDVLDEIENFLDPTQEGRDERQALLGRFRAFDDHPWYLDNTPWVLSADGFLARRFALETLNVGVLCLNTAWFCGGKDDQYKLTPGLQMVEQGLSELKECSPIFVLGHHPLEWLNPTHAKQIRAVLSKANAIYFHGHLHKAEHITQSGGATPLVALQAGCAFFARNDEKWLTRLLWGGYEAATQNLFVQPKKWIPDHCDWAIDSDAFPNSLRAPGKDFWIIPTRFKSTTTPAESKLAHAAFDHDIPPPEGWVLLTASFFAERQQPISEDRLLQYFDGRVPQWEDILSGSIPSRTIVADLVATITKGIEVREPSFTVLLGAGGEGKSTAFLQALHLLAKNQSVKILWRSNPERSLPASFVTSLAGTKDTWLLASDEGDSLIGDTYKALRGLTRRSEVHFFITCRDTDWIESHGNDHVWSQLTTYSERRIKGLDDTDARAIVTAWSRLGVRGLGKLSGLELEEAVQQLLNAACLEASTNDGAFLGAMLRVRVGVALRDHVVALMGRLESREISGLPGKTLLDAFAYIAIPHAYNILFLSKPVLARALGIDETKVRRRILGPLGEEAAASAIGQFILIRHRAIAEAAREILSRRFNFDSEDILAELVRAAIIAGLESALVPHLKNWRYLSTRMFEEGNQSLGVRLAAAALSADNRNSYLAVKLAQLYREAGQPEQSVEVFRNSIYKARGNRGFFTEWATGEGHIGNAAVSIWLKSVSIADETEMRPPDVRDVAFGFTGCSVSFLSLFERYLDEIYLLATVACVQLGRRVTILPETASDILADSLKRAVDLGGEKSFTVKEALDYFLTGIRRAYEQREIELPSVITQPSRLHFVNLQRLLKIPS
jgi:predicted phosphodiesterase